MDERQSTIQTFIASERAIGWALVVLVVLTFIEFGFDYLTKQERDVRDTWSNVAIGFVFEACFMLPIVLAIIGGIIFLGNHLPWRIPASPLTWVVALLLVDFCYYWSHRLEHYSRAFWATHHVHHSSQDFNLSTAHRLQFTLPFIGWFRMLPVVLMGFEPTMVWMLFHVLIVGQIPLHTRYVGNLGWLEWIFNTPAHHRLHHGRESVYVNKNFGGIFIVWDRMFGTLATETVPVTYGLETNIGTKNPILVTFHEPMNVLRGWFRLRNMSDRIIWVFGSTKNQISDDGSLCKAKSLSS